MRLIDTIVGRENIESLPADMQEQARSAATREFWINTILGGKGFASGLQGAREVIPSIQAAEQRRQLQNIARTSTVPVGGINVRDFTTPGGQGDLLLQQQEAFGQDPVAAQMTDQALMRNAPRQFSPQLYAQNVSQFAALRDPKLAVEMAEASSPKFNEQGIGVSFGQPVASLPISRDNTQQRFNLQTGQIEAAPIAGIQQARRAAAIPSLAPNIEFTPTGGAQVVPGATTAVQSLAQAETSGRQAGESPYRTRTVTLEDGTKVEMPEPEWMRLFGGSQQPAAGQPTTSPTGGLPGAVSAISPMQTERLGTYKSMLESARTGNEVATKRAGTIQQLRNALNNPNFDTGAITPFKTNMTNLLSSFGVTGDRAQSFLTSSASFRQAVNDLTMGSLAELVGAISNFEIDFSQKRFGTITDPTQANMYALDLLEAADKRRRDYFNFVNKNPSPDVQELWNNSAEGQRSLFEDPKLRKWLPQAPIQSGPQKGKTAHQLPSGDWVVFN
jgi:hypothetical protein